MGCHKKEAHHLEAATEFGPESGSDAPLRWRHLTKAQRQAVANGCGGKGGPFDPPEFRFHGSCLRHDLNYWIGCTEEDRKKADRQFFSGMRLDARGAKIPKRWLYLCLALMYYLSVRWFGRRFFHYADRERTRADLDGRQGCGEV